MFEITFPYKFNYGFSTNSIRINYFKITSFEYENLLMLVIGCSEMEFPANYKTWDLEGVGGAATFYASKWLKKIDYIRKNTKWALKTSLMWRIK